MKFSGDKVLVNLDKSSGLINSNLYSGSVDNWLTNDFIIDDGEIQ